jgi:hypothetical protein
VVHPRLVVWYGVLLWLAYCGVDSGLALTLEQTRTPSADVSILAPVTFAWNAPLTNADGSPAVIDNYVLYRSVDGGSTFMVLQTLPATVLTTSDPSIPNGTVCYQVTARNLKGESGPSNRLCFQVPTAVPMAPTNLH